MSRNRYPLAALVLFLSAVVGQAQPFGGPLDKPTPIPLLAALLPYIGGENVKKELKLTPEQSKRLLAFRTKEWDHVYTTARKDLKSDEMNKAAVAELTTVLKPEQLPRAKELAAQTVWNQYRYSIYEGRGRGTTTGLSYSIVSASLLQTYPEFVAALKLSEAQANILKTTDNQFRYFQGVYLTSAQTDAIKTLLGPPMAGPMVAEYDTRSRGGFGRFMTGPQDLAYTASPDVQKELKLTAEQVKALDELRPQSTSPRSRTPLNPDVSPAADEKARADQLAAGTAAMAKILTPEQRTRLDQLGRRTLATNAEFFATNTFGKELDVTAEQRKAYQAVVKAHDEAIAKAVLADESVEKVKTAVTALNKAHNEACDAILTPEQRAKRTELLGADFQGRMSVNPFGGRPSTNLARIREMVFGKYVTHLSTLARYEGVQAELKMTAEQVKKAEAAAQEVTTKFSPRGIITGDDEKMKQLYADRSAFVEKALADILDPGQRDRFRELMLQQTESRPSFPFSTTTGPVSYPGVAEAIKLTAEQKKKLLTGGEAAADVLTAEQQKAIKAMLGKPVDVAKVFIDPSSVRPTQISLLPAYDTLLDTTLWGELKLTPEQITKLAPAANEYLFSTAVNSGGFGLNSGGGNGFGAPPANDTAKLKATIDTFTQAADAILTADQRKRLDQLSVQQRAATSLANVLAVPFLMDVQKALAITPEQMQKINTLSANSQELANLIGIGPGGFGEGTTLTDALAKLRDRLDEKLMSELTPAQTAKWKELIGEPYAGFVKQPLFGLGRRGGGPGGPGGRGF